MPKQLKQHRSSDENEVAFQLVQRSTQEQNPAPTATPSTISEYMAQIGRKGGKVGGKRRLKTMTPEERRKVARQAAKARWGKRPKKG